MNDDKLPIGSLVKVELEVRIPAAATEEDVKHWLNFSLGHCGGISAENPLYKFDAEAWGPFGISFQFTGLVGRREKFDVQKLEGGGETYRVRYHRDRAPEGSAP